MLIDSQCKTIRTDEEFFLNCYRNAEKDISMPSLCQFQSTWWYSSDVCIMSCTSTVGGLFYLSPQCKLCDSGMSILLTISTVVSTCSIQIGGHSGTKHDCSSREQSVQTDAILWWSKLSILLFSYCIMRLPFSKPSPSMTVFLFN